MCCRRSSSNSRASPSRARRCVAHGMCCGWTAASKHIFGGLVPQLLYCKMRLNASDVRSATHSGALLLQMNLLELAKQVQKEQALHDVGGDEATLRSVPGRVQVGSPNSAVNHR